MLLMPALRSRAVRLAALVLVLAAGATAWGFTHRSQQPAPRSDVQAALSPAEMSSLLPLYNLLYKRTDTQLRIAQAQRLLVIDCMARHGFRYTPPAVAMSQAADEYPTPFGLETLTLPSAAPTDVPPSPESRSKAFGRALFGDPQQRITAKGETLTVTRPANGCQAESEKRLLGADRVRWLQLRLWLGDGDKEARKQVEKDPAFRAANGRWSGCMARAGFQGQKDPVTLVFSLPRDTDFSRTDVTQADVRCKAETGYLRSAYTRLGAEQRAWLKNHADVLTDWNALQRRQDRIARQVLHER